MGADPGDYGYRRPTHTRLNDEACPCRGKSRQIRGGPVAVRLTSPCNSIAVKDCKELLRVRPGGRLPPLRCRLASTMQSLDLRWPLRCASSSCCLPHPPISDLYLWNVGRQDVNGVT